jgi:hypothetical protein
VILSGPSFRCGGCSRRLHETWLTGILACIDKKPDPWGITYVKQHSDIAVAANKPVICEEYGKGNSLGQRAAIIDPWQQAMVESSKLPYVPPFFGGWRGGFHRLESSYAWKINTAVELTCRGYRTSSRLLLAAWRPLDTSVYRT